MKVDWKEVWEKFDKWLLKQEEKGKCNKCGRKDWAAYWEYQQKAIQRLERLVDNQLKGRK